MFVPVTAALSRESGESVMQGKTETVKTFLQITVM
jgi:hypothetical protein